MLLVSISARTVGVEERSTQLGETATFLQPIASVSSAQSGSERGRAFIQLIYATSPFVIVTHERQGICHLDSTRRHVPTLDYRCE